MEKINESLVENKRESLASYLENTELVELDDNRAVITTPYMFNRLILNNKENLNVIDSCFQNLLKKPVSVIVQTNDEYQKVSIEAEIEKALNDNVIEGLTFDNFVEGPCNIEAKTAAFSVARNPGVSYFNPLVIYGSSGLGKTHLLSAIGNYIKENDQDKKLLYISSTDLVKEVTTSIREQRIDEYKNQLNSLDVLLFDDIQNLSNKPKTNDVFFEIYNELYNNHKQIVLTSDRPPHEIKDIEERLKTRFTQGLSVTIQSLEEQTAYKILEQKIRQSMLKDQESTIEIRPEVLSYIAKNFSSDVRNLEGALNRLLFYSINFSSSDVIDLNMAMEAFRDNKNLNDSKKDVLEVKDIIRTVADYYGLTEKQLRSKSRTKNIANARHISMYLCRKHLDLSYLQIGKEFGNRDHSTVSSAFEKIENNLKTNESYARAIAEIESKLQ
ncbi:MAG: chromosomal replication initiator protein DnaA [Erysipelotrichaceae bacterium]|nr:chromosomal replication initiator protein DnaA [Erysipelotrichaceae bacterium]MBR5049465.1 chromosomal replication initiator protein DnaA [Erysipelotrichaceae bacterium]